MGGAHTQTITNNNPGMFSYIGVFSMGNNEHGSAEPKCCKDRGGENSEAQILKIAVTSSTGSPAEG